MNNPNVLPKKNANNDDEKKKQGNRQKQNRYWVSYLIFNLLGLWLFQQFILKPLAVQSTEIPYSEFKSKVAAGQIVQVTLGTDSITGTMKNPNTTDTKDPTVPFTTVAIPNGDDTLIPALDKAGIDYTASEPTSPLENFLLSWGLPLLLIGALWTAGERYMAKNMTGSGGMTGLFGVSQSKATEVKPETVGITFKDVGGADEAIGELQETINFLKEPEKYSRLGGNVPKGVLLVGPPGTGKTLLAKATAGEAGVPFFETSGSEFVEMFVGVGAARVRSLFEMARKVAPAVIFIDEIDAIGQSRSNATKFGTNDEREQTLNQLLTEIDGFHNEKDKPVIIMAATNRPEVLDPALLRAGRFDRQITVGAPDLTGRLQILKIHSKQVKLDPGFDLDRAARITAGFSGADLANVMNEAALAASRRGADAVANRDFEAALERIIAGTEKRSHIMNEQERTTVAYHECGHAMVAELVPHGDPVAKVSIVPHSRGALGYTMQMPTEDRYLLTRDELQDRIAIMLGGRAAEQVVFNVISTGASDDIQRASELARRMVTEFGMSEKLGSVRYASQQYQFLAGGEGGVNASPETQKIIDEEVQRLVTEQYQRAQGFLTEHRAALEQLSQQLLKTETIDGTAVKEALTVETKS